MDGGFRSAAREAALRGAAEAFEPHDGLAHRELMRRAKILVSLIAADPGSAPAGAIARAGELVAALAALQGPSGLFEGGDNVLSPPDSAFTINDACDAHALLTEARGAAAGLRERIGTVILAAAPALAAGGVHTPNHRWELASALARVHRSFPEPRLIGRVNAWLGEGIDLDGDGFFSERSPNYASAVSLPSLFALADILGRADLAAAAERNLELTLWLLAQDGTVETVVSRRQDQGRPFPVSRYLAFYRRLAVETGRGDFAWAAERAAEGGVRDPGLLAELLLHPALGDALPPATAPAREGTAVFAGVSLAVRRAPACELVVYGGSDYPGRRRIRSGLANDPTFLRLFAGDAVLDSVRLSRTFFGLGPFRAESFAVREDGAVELLERASAAYYQPLPPDRRRADGAYALGDEGRFSAAMAFADRAADEVALDTRIVAHPHDDGVDLDLTLDGPAVPWTLELAFRPGGAFDVPGPRAAVGAFVAQGASTRYRCGADAVRVELIGHEPAAEPAPYFPGEDYAALGGTDAAPGLRLLIGGTAPAAFRLRLRAEREVGR